MANVWRIAVNGVKNILKRRMNILIYVLMPPVLAVLFMMLISSGQSSAIAIGVYDGDDSVSSRHLIENITDSDKYTVTEYRAEELETAVGKKDVRAGISIPDGFEAYMKGAGGEVDVEVMSIEGVAVTGWLKGFLEQKISMLYRAGRKYPEGPYYKNLIESYKDSFVSVISREVTDTSNRASGTRAGFGMYTFASLFGIWSICSLGFREKVQHTYQRIMSGPVSPWQYMAGNTMTCLFFALIHAVVSVTAMYNVFNLTEILPLAEFAVLLAVFYLATIPMGLFLISLAKTEASVLAVTVVYLQITCMLGGCYWQVEWMPDFMQKLARGTIQFWFTSGISGLMKGNGLGEISTNLIILGCCAVAFTILYVIFENLKKNRMAV